MYDFWLTAINSIIRKTVAISLTDANVLAVAEAVNLYLRVWAEKFHEF